MITPIAHHVCRHNLSVFGRQVLATDCNLSGSRTMLSKALPQLKPLRNQGKARSVAKATYSLSVLRYLRPTD
jgi:hypothetical protein